MSKLSGVVVLSLAGALALAGCSDDKKPVEGTTSTTTTTWAPSSTTSSPSTTTPPATTTGPIANPDVPAAARAHTPAGAEAFVRYFYDQANLAGRIPKVGLISKLSLPSCTTCDNLEGIAAESVQRGVRVDGDLLLTQSADAGSSSGNGDELVHYVAHQNVLPIVDARGTRIGTSKAATINTEVSLLWTNTGWGVASIKDIR